jgi:hypothetical protein
VAVTNSEILAIAMFAFWMSIVTWIFVGSAVKGRRLAREQMAALERLAFSEATRRWRALLGESFGYTAFWKEQGSVIHVRSADLSLSAHGTNLYKAIDAMDNAIVRHIEEQRGVVLTEAGRDDE